MMKFVCLFAICSFSLSTIYSIPNKGNWQTVEDDITNVLGELTKLHEQVEDIEARQKDTKQDKVNDLKNVGIVKRSDKQDSLKAGSYLKFGEFIASSNYNSPADEDRVPFYSAYMESTGDFAVYIENDLTRTDRVKLWSTGTSGESVSIGLEFQSSGNLELSDKNGNFLWQSYTSGGSDCELFIQDDGRLVIFNTTTNEFIWGAGYLLPDTVLPVGQSLFNGKYSAEMKSNGNFILWDADGTKLCSTKTAGNTDNLLEGLRMTSVGALIIKNKNSKILWYSGTAISITYDGDRLQLTDTPSLQVIVRGVLQFESFCSNAKKLKFQAP